MKIKPKHLAILAGATLVLTVVVIALTCFLQNRTITLDNAEQVYADSVSEIRSASDMVLNISTTTKTCIGNSEFLETAQQRLAYSGFGSDDMLARVEETRNIGDHSIQISEAYNGTTAYLSMEGCQFSSEISADEYMARFAPAILLDAQLYGSITGIRDAETYTISFAQPTAAESWALYDSAEFVDASGTAYISRDGQLQKSIYFVTYTRGDATISLTVTAEPSNSTDPVEMPQDTSGFVSIEYLDGLRMLERATGYLLQGKETFTTYSDSAYFQAFGDERSQQISMYTHDADSWSALVSTKVTLTNTSRIDDISQLSKTELFVNGAYTASTDGGEAVSNADIDKNTMLAYCQNLLVGTIMLPEHVTDAQISETEKTWLITYSAGDAFASVISSDVCQRLYQNPDMLDELAVSSTTDVMECYLELDKNTGLPVASGIRYSGTYTIEDIPYQLRFDADQNYDIICDTAIEEINKAAGA